MYLAYDGSGLGRTQIGAALAPFEFQFTVAAGGGGESYVGGSSFFGNPFGWFSGGTQRNTMLGVRIQEKNTQPQLHPATPKLGGVSCSLLAILGESAVDLYQEAAMFRTLLLSPSFCCVPRLLALAVKVQRIEDSCQVQYLCPRDIDQEESFQVAQSRAVTVKCSSP